VDNPFASNNDLPDHWRLRLNSAHFVSKLDYAMDYGWLIAFLSGGMGGLAVHAISTRLFRTAGGYEDHEERIALVEGIVRSVQRGQKAERMRAMRAQAAANDLGPGPTDGQQPFPWPTGAEQPATDAKTLKQQLRARVGRGRIQ